MIHSCPQWETCPPFHEVKSLPLTGCCTICFGQSRTDHGVVGRLFRWVRHLLDTLGIPGFGKSHERGFNICLLAHALFLGPAPMRVRVLLLSGSLPTHRKLKSCSLPYFSLEKQLLRQHRAVQYRVSFWARLLTNKVIKLMAGTFPKSLRVVAVSSMLGTDTQSIFQNIKNKLPSKYLSHNVLDPLRYF